MELAVATIEANGWAARFRLAWRIITRGKAKVWMDLGDEPATKPAMAADRQRSNN